MRLPYRVKPLLRPIFPCRWRGKCQHACITLCTLVVCLVYMSTDVVKRMESIRMQLRPTGDHKDSIDYLVDTSGCRIPNLDPMDPSVTKFIDPYPPISCNFKPPFTYTDGMYLRMNKSVMHSIYTRQLLHCEYQEIYRPAEGNDNVYCVNKTVLKFSDDILVDCSFIRVVCFDINYTMIYTNFHAFIKPVNQKENVAATDTLKPRILIVGLDSVSRLNFLRQMPQTKTVLAELGAFELLGYNKVADNTLVNLMPMFTGKFLHGLEQNEWTSLDYFDDYQFIWKKFQKLGYKTLFGEDAPEISIFNYMKQGFKVQPMDYYLRPFSLAIEEYSALWNNNHDCFRDIPETKLVLDWTQDFLNLYKTNPYFAFIFLTRLTHDNVNKAGAADALYANFFKDLKETGHLDNTIMLFFSDHGMRFGQVRETHVGKLEERLPFFYMIIPEAFQRLHISVVSNLKENQHRLTTPFDVYETLLSLVQEDVMEEVPKDQQHYGKSLFSSIPEERTCEQAGIDPHWCTCHQTKSVNVMDTVVIQAALKITNAINDKLVVVAQRCEKLVLKGIKDALYLWHKNTTDTQAMRSYLITLVVTPGNGLFEATVQHDLTGQKFAVLGEPSRINMYGNQGKCIKQHSLQKYCYCREG